MTTPGAQTPSAVDQVTLHQWYPIAAIAECRDAPGQETLLLDVPISYGVGSGGRGWVALALVVFAGWRPGATVAGALLFGLCDAAQLRLQGTTTDIPYEVFLALPYVVTLVALVLRARASRTPAALGVAYVRGAH